MLKEFGKFVLKKRKWNKNVIGKTVSNLHNVYFIKFLQNRL